MCCIEDRAIFQTSMARNSDDAGVKMERRELAGVGCGLGLSWWMTKPPNLVLRNSSASELHRIAAMVSRTSDLPVDA